MKTLTKTLVLPLALLAPLTLLVGCDDAAEDLEDAGEKIEDAVDDAGDAADELINDAERAIDDAVDG